MILVCYITKWEVNVNQQCNGTEYSDHERELSELQLNVIIVTFL